MCIVLLCIRLQPTDKSVEMSTGFVLLFSLALYETCVKYHLPQCYMPLVCTRRAGNIPLFCNFILSLQCTSGPFSKKQNNPITDLIAKGFDEERLTSQIITKPRGCRCCPGHNLFSFYEVI